MKDYTNQTLIRGLSGPASERGKIVANKCLDRHIFLDTLKLEKLLILMQVAYIRETGKIFFPETIVVRKHAMIDEVDEDFRGYGARIPADMRFVEYITLLRKEKEVVDSIIDRYGNLDVFKLEETSDIQLIHKMAEKLNTQNIQPSLIHDLLCRFPSPHFTPTSSKEDRLTYFKKYN